MLGLFYIPLPPSPCPVPVQLFQCLCSFLITRGEVTNGGFGLVLDGSEVKTHDLLNVFYLKRN
jgi:hypothetical protein